MACAPERNLTRRKTQFSLRGLMVAILLVCAFLSATTLVPEWSFLILVCVLYAVEQYFRRWSRTHSPRHPEPSVAWRMYEFSWSVFSGLVDGGILVFLGIMILGNALGLRVDFLVAVRISLAAGFALGIMFPSFFRKFFLPLPG